MLDYFRIKYKTLQKQSKAHKKISAEFHTTMIKVSILRIIFLYVAVVYGSTCEQKRKQTYWLEPLISRKNFNFYFDDWVVRGNGTSKIKEKSLKRRNSCVRHNYSSFTAGPYNTLNKPQKFFSSHFLSHFVFLSIFMRISLEVNVWSLQSVISNKIQTCKVHIGISKSGISRSKKSGSC